MRMPAIGFGCSPLRPGGERVEVADAVRAALAGQGPATRLEAR